MYERFELGHNNIIVNSFKDILNDEIQNKLLQENSILIPHGTLVGTLTSDEIINELKIPVFGNKKVLLLEKEAELHKRWLDESGVRTPMVFNNIDDVDRLVMVKFTGAKGGQGYFASNSSKEIKEKVKQMGPEAEKNLWIQEFIRGVPMYFHFFKHLDGKNKLTGIDIRYESDANAFGRIPAIIQYPLKLRPGFTVVGNIPVVVRESLLQKIFRIADNIVEASKKLAPPGLIGPYCVETIITPNLEIVVIEISARIVAGTTAWIPTSPYAEFSYGKSVAVGELIAEEILNAYKNDSLEKIVS